MRQEDREALLWEGVPRAERPEVVRGKSELQADLRSNPLAGRRLPLRLRNFAPTTEGYLAALHGPLPYMVRLSAIEEETNRQRLRLEHAWLETAEAAADADAFARTWTRQAEGWVFDEVNELIDRHNRFYPIESRLPMDPRTGDYALVFGRDYRLARLDSAWVLREFPPELEVAESFRRRAAAARAADAA
ncbi:MAG: hypothetical protein ACKVUT_15200 [Gaiella sp.]